MPDRERLRAYWELTKPGITRLVLVTTAVGFYLGSRSGVNLTLLFHTLLGTGLVAAGTNALNQHWERDVDARMRRTCRRPLPSGRLAPHRALAFASTISVLGIVQLVLAVNVRAALVVTLSLASYVFIYTPLKKRTTAATWVGAVPGALPVLAGWVASGSPVGPAAWALFGILFLWQLPHFLSLAWIYIGMTIVGEAWRPSARKTRTVGVPGVRRPSTRRRWPWSARCHGCSVSWAGCTCSPR